jgi:DNA-binding transcriptional regulator GbsR (MarR family)
MNLTPVTRAFVLHWGEMGTRWGVNRTVAQVHALLYLAPRPLPADEIAETLAVARSNVSQSLRELRRWGLVHVVHVLGDRREHFATHGDVWQMLKLVLQERKRRELDPTIEVLRRTVRGLPAGGDAETRRRLGDLLELFEATDFAYAQLAPVPAGALRRLARRGRQLRKLLGLGA